MTITIWNDLKSRLKKVMGTHEFSIWIQPLDCTVAGNGKLEFTVPNRFFQKQLWQKHGELLEKELSKLTSGNPRTAFKVVDSGVPAAKVQKARRPHQMNIPQIAVRAHSGRYLRREYTFNQFVVGENNEFAYSASMAVARKKNHSQSALFLLSKTGMGKTHLTQAIGHFIIKKRPSERVYYVSAQDFSVEMVQAFRTDTVSRFKQKYRNGCDILMIEDVHHLSGKPRTQEELASILDYLLEAEKKIIFSSSYLPSDIPKLDDKLSSRLSSGLISNIEAPDYRTRLRILDRKSVYHGFDVSEDVQRYLACTLTDDVRQLESGLVGVGVKSSLMNVPISMNLAESVVDTIMRRRENLTIADIKKMISREYGITVRDLESKSRRRQIVRPRQMAMYLSRKYTDAPLQAIGKSFNRYHATVLHAVNAVEGGMRKDIALRRQAHRLCEKIESGDGDNQ